MKKLKILSLLAFAIVILFSCSGSEEAGVQSIKITLTETTLDVGDTAALTVVADDQMDVTSSAKIYVNGAEIQGSVFAAQSIGTFKIKATYDGVTSNEVSVSVEAIGPRFQKNVVIEDYTGTWCGWCPRVAYGIEQAKAATNFCIPIAAHTGDGMSNSYASSLISGFSVTGYPTAYIDRDKKWNYPEPNNVSQITGLVAINSTVGVALESSLNGTSMELKVKVKFGKSITKKVKLVVLVLEDGIVEDQQNYTTYYGGKNVLTGFVHDHVLRHSLTNVMGDDIPTSETVKNNVYAKNFNVSVPSAVKDTSKMSFVVIVTDGASKKAINARSIHVNASNDFVVK